MRARRKESFAEWSELFDAQNETYRFFNTVFKGYRFIVIKKVALHVKKLEDEDEEMIGKDDMKQNNPLLIIMSRR